MPLSTLRLTPRGATRKTQGQDGVALSFPAGILPPLQHAGLTRRTPGGDSNCDSRPGERTLGCAPSGLITSVGRTHSKNGRPDLLSVPTRANVVSGRQYGRLFSHSISQTPSQLRLLGARGGKAYGRNQRARRARLTTSPAAIPVRVAPQETTARAIAVLDARFPWLAG
jgi:hypothetical protein